MYKITIQNLLTVKSIVTLICTIVFAFLAVTHYISADAFKDIFYIIIAFYFGTQTQKIQSTTESTQKGE